jgi:GTP cyclohydrolase I
LKKLKKDNLTLDTKDTFSDFSPEEIGDDHLFASLETPLKEDAFKLSDLEKKKKNRNLIWSNNGRYGT